MADGVAIHTHDVRNLVNGNVVGDQIGGDQVAGNKVTYSGSCIENRVTVII